MLNKKKFIITFLIMGMINNCYSVKHSFVQETNFTKPIVLMQTEIEHYYYSYLADIKFIEDPVCALSSAKKKELCALIFQLRNYEDLEIYLNTVAISISTPVCENKLLSFRTVTHDSKKIIEQKMYPCRGRHQIVRTSFIEDNYYNTFYLSGGSHNRVYVYMRSYNNISDSYYIFDYIENIDLKNLENIQISMNNVTTELKMNRQIFPSYHYMELETIYIREQKLMKNYSFDDSVCNLEYEKKVSLCEILFKERTILQVALNKSATYVFSMACSLKPIKIRYYKSYRTMQIEENMFPCYARTMETTNDNLLLDENLQKFYLSRGPRRNSVFVYFRTKLQNKDENFYISQLLENVEIRKLKGTIITIEELIEESLPTYQKIQELVNSVEKRTQQIDIMTKLLYPYEKTYHKSLGYNKSQDKITENIQQQAESSWSKGTSQLLKKHNEIEYNDDKPQRKIKESSIKKPSNEKEIKIEVPKSEVNTAFKDSVLLGVMNQEGISQNLINILDVATIGTQVLDRLLKKKGDEIVFKSSQISPTKERIRRKLIMQRKQEKKETSLKEQKYNLAVKELIHEMKKFVSVKFKKEN